MDFTDIKKPELLAPAGDLNKLKIAITYGADAVYMGGQLYGLRANSKNFKKEEMIEGIKFAHDRGKKVFVTANIYAHNNDFANMESFFYDLEEMKVDGAIISDVGVFSVARKILKNTEIHISTQANNTNYQTAQFWKEQGASRVVLARELSLREISEIYAKTNGEIELECFVHGAMCISYSGRCLLSNYMTGRDSNRGDCAQSCRWKYNLSEEKRPNEYMPVYEDERGTYIFNSKDLCTIKHIPELCKAGIKSFKIEGRMKSIYYVGSTIKAYREAIDTFFESEELYNQKKDYFYNEVTKNSHRDFTTGFYFGKTTGDSQIYTNSSYIRSHDFVGLVLEYDEQTGYAKIEQRNKIVKGDKVEFFLQKGENFFQTINEILDDKKNPIDEAPHPQQIIYIKTDKPVKALDMLRMEL